MALAANKGIKSLEDEECMEAWCDCCGVLRCLELCKCCDLCRLSAVCVSVFLSSVPVPVSVEYETIRMSPFTHKKRACLHVLTILSPNRESANASDALGVAASDMQKANVALPTSPTGIQKTSMEITTTSIQEESTLMSFQKPAVMNLLLSSLQMNCMQLKTRAILILESSELLTLAFQSTQLSRLHHYVQQREFSTHQLHHFYILEFFQVFLQ